MYKQRFENLIDRAAGPSKEEMRRKLEEKKVKNIDQLELKELVKKSGIRGDK